MKLSNIFNKALCFGRSDQNRKKERRNSQNKSSQKILIVKGKM